MTVTSTYIDLLRHGEAEGGLCYRGYTDDALSTKGWQQMHTKIASSSDWELIISSPLLRCQTFSSLLAKKLQCPLLINKALQEINFGDWEGKTAAQIDPQLLARFYANPTTFYPPNGEHFIDFQQRVLHAWQLLLQQHQGKRILIVTHAGVIRIILAHILGMDTQCSFRLKITHACLSSIINFSDTETGDFFQLLKHG